MTDGEKARCEAWVKAHAHKWQTLKRAQWTYVWHEKTLVRYVAETQMREDEVPLILEYLCSSDCAKTLSLYDQSIDKSWTPQSAWYEVVNNKVVNGVYPVRLYHALKIDAQSGGDGPYVVENGCMYKVTWTFYWKQTSVLEVPSGTSGVSYRITNLTRNDEDGTFSYVYEKRERVQQDIESFIAETDVYENREHEEHLGVKGDSSAGGKAASQTQGKKVVRTVRKNEDCTHDVLNDTQSVNAVPNASTEVSVDVRGTVTTTVNRNMPSKASAENLPIGTSVRNEETEFGVWNQTIRKVTATVRGIIRRACSVNIFREDHSEMKVVNDDPGFTHAENTNADAGTVNEKTASLNDLGGWDVTDRTVTEKNVNNAVVEVHKYVDGVTRTTTDRNSVQSADSADLGIGESVRNQKTDSGRYDITRTEVDNHDVGTVSSSCLQSATEHRDENTSVVASDPGDAEVETEDGKIVERTVQLTERGAFRVTDSARTAKFVSANGSGGAKFAGETVKTIRNAGDTSEFVNDEIPDGRRIEVSVSKNEFGRFDGTVRTTEYSNASGTSTVNNPLVREVDVVNTSSDPNPQESVETKGSVTTYSVSPDVMGRASVRKTVRTGIAKSNLANFNEIKWNDTEVSESRYYRTTTIHENRLEVYRNWPSAPVPDTGDKETCSISVSINEFGLIDATLHYRAYVSTTIEDIGSSGSGGSGEQGDRRGTVVGHKTMSYRKNDGSILVYQGTASFNVRYLWSTKTNMMSEVANGQNYSDWGVVSKLCGWYAVIVLSMQGQPTWELQKTINTKSS